MIDKQIKKFVDKFRACKGDNEEKEYMNQMLGDIRLAMANKNKLSEADKMDILIKLIWSSMNGSDVRFAQVGVIDYVYDQSLVIKALGYFGSSLFLSDDSEILLMITNRLIYDLFDLKDDEVYQMALKNISQVANSTMA